jgi:hypothetical protein
MLFFSSGCGEPLYEYQGDYIYRKMLNGYVRHVALRPLATTGARQKNPLDSRARTAADELKL